MTSLLFGVLIFLDLRLDEEVDDALFDLDIREDGVVKFHDATVDKWFDVPRN